MTDDVQARVYRDEQGQLVLEDPAAAGMIAAVEHHNLKVNRENLLSFVTQNRERIDYFTKRILDRGLSPQDVVVTCIQVDDPFGKPLTEALMPGHDWQPYRDRGEMPVARGLAGRDSFQDLLDEFVPEMAARLSKASYALVAVGYGAILVLSLNPPDPESFWDRLQRPDAI